MYAVKTDPKPAPSEEDDHVLFYGMEWKDFEVMLAVRGDAAGVRMYYLDGVIELMSPSNIREYRKTTLARLLEQWAIETLTNLNGFGSWTLKGAPKEAGAEPDECYVLGDPAGREKPDLVIEVDWSHKGLPKREIYRRLGVPELWTLQRDGKLVLHVLEGGTSSRRAGRSSSEPRYVESAKSKVLPKLDVAWLVSFLALEPQNAAVHALRGSLRGGSPPPATSEARAKKRKRAR